MYCSESKAGVSVRNGLIFPKYQHLTLLRYMAEILPMWYEAITIHSAHRAKPVQLLSNIRGRTFSVRYKAYLYSVSRVHIASSKQWRHFGFIVSAFLWNHVCSPWTIGITTSFFFYPTSNRRCPFMPPGVPGNYCPFLLYTTLQSNCSPVRGDGLYAFVSFWRWFAVKLPYPWI